MGTYCIQNIDGSKLEHIVWNKYFNKEKLKICALHLQRGNDVQGSALLYIKPYLNGHYPVFIAVLYRNSKFPFSSCNNLIDFIHSLYLLHPFSYYYKKQFCFLYFSCAMIMTSLTCIFRCLQLSKISKDKIVYHLVHFCFDTRNIFLYAWRFWQKIK